MASVVSTPVGYWTGLYFGMDLVALPGGVDLTTIASAIMLATYPNQTTPVTWTCTLSNVTPQTLTLNHPWGPNDTVNPGTITVQAILTDTGGLIYPTSKVQCIVKG
jgi:hypothetical protein